ncbi:SHOCT domain-containing protein [archaeon]|nr:SHOCT domain-containing protein [archaeon]
MSNRPTGITILAILEIIGGIVVALLVTASGLFTSAMMSMGGLYAGLGGAITGILGTVAAIHFIIAFGLLSGKPWGRKIVIILSIISLIMGALSFSILTIIIDAIVLYYMWRPHVMAYFQGRAVYANEEIEPINVLRSRLAKGEITQEEFDELKKKMDSN